MIASEARAIESGQHPRLRIGFVYDAHYPDRHGGAERRYHELATRLGRRHHVEYVTWGLSHESLAAERPYLVRSVGTAPEFYGRDGKRTVREALAFAARLVPSVIRGRYDVIDCSATPYIPVYGCWLASRVTRTPLVVTWHEYWGEHWDAYLGHRPAVAAVAGRLERGALKFGDWIVPVSAFTAARMGVDPGQHHVRIVGNGVALEKIRRARPGSRSEVVFIGRLIEDKGVELLLAALALLDGRSPPVKGRIVGDGPHRSRLEALAAQLGLGDRVRFLGHVDDAALLRHLKGAHMMVLPSVREGFAIAVVEAQAAGVVPIVVRSAHSAATELVQDGVNGLTCDPEPASLAACIATLLEDPVRRAAMAAAGRRSASGRDWDVIAEEMERVYLEAAPRGARENAWPI